MSKEQENLLDEEYKRGQTPEHGSFFHNFLEVVEDGCPGIDYLEHCSCYDTRQAVVWSQVINKENEDFSSEDETRWLSLGYFSGMK